MSTENLLKISPYSAPGIAFLIRDDWEHCESRAQGWASQFPNNPTVIGALANKYYRLNQDEKAQPLLEQLVKLESDEWGFEDLADIYLRHGEEDKWLATLKLFLTHEDLGLSPASVQVKIANHYLATDRLEQARQWAETAANESGASWAIACAAGCCEGLRDFKAVETWQRAQTDRYGEIEWLYFCQRTGEGDLAAARGAADECIAKKHGAQDPDGFAKAGVVALLDAKPAEARSNFQKAMAALDEPWCAVQAALACQELNDTEGRDAALDFVASHCNQAKDGDGRIEAEYFKFASLMRAAGGSPIPLTEVESILRTAPSELLPSLLYFARQQRQLLGDLKSAKSFYGRCAATRATNSSAYTLACQQLRLLGIDQFSFWKSNAVVQPAQ